MKVEKTVTISADYFVKLYIESKDGRHSQEDCVTCPIVKERDELKRQLETKEDQCKECAALCASKMQCDELKVKLAAAERCIEALNKRVGYLKDVEDIIHAWRTVIALGGK